MQQITVKAEHQEHNGIQYVKMLEIELPDYRIGARLLRLEEDSTNTTYDVWIGRNMRVADGKSIIIRDWSMRGAYRPVAGGDKLFNHRSNYGATLYTQGSPYAHESTARLISAIFDNLLGTCDEANTDVISDYVGVAEAMYQARLVNGIENQYRASIMTPNKNLTGSRVWRVEQDQLKFDSTVWTLNIDGANRLTHRDHALGTTYKKVVEIMADKAAAAVRGLAA